MCPTCPTWYSRIGRTVGSGAAQGYGWYSIGRPTCPTWYSRIGRTVGSGAAQGYGWYSIGRPTYPTWYSRIGRTVGSGAALGYGWYSIGCPTILHGTVVHGVVRWYMGFPWSFPPVLHGMVAVVYSGPRYMWIPMDSSPVPWYMYSGIPTCVQWILTADLDITELANKGSLTFAKEVKLK